MKKADSLEDVLDVADLKQIRYLALHAEAKPGEVPSGPERYDLPVTVTYHPHDENEMFAVKIGIELALPVVEITVSVVGEYELVEPTSISAELAGEFIRARAFQDIYPYVRQGVSLLSSMMKVTVADLPLYSPKTMNIGAQIEDELSS